MIKNRFQIVLMSVCWLVLFLLWASGYLSIFGYWIIGVLAFVVVLIALGSVKKAE